MLLFTEIVFIMLLIYTCFPEKSTAILVFFRIFNGFRLKKKNRDIRIASFSVRFFRQPSAACIPRNGA